jgi:hypothetical protein
MCSRRAHIVLHGALEGVDARLFGLLGGLVRVHFRLAFALLLLVLPGRQARRARDGGHGARGGGKGVRDGRLCAVRPGRPLLRLVPDRLLLNTCRLYIEQL